VTPCRLQSVPLLAALSAALAVLVPLAAQTGPVVARASSVTGPALVYSGNPATAFSLTPGFILNPGDRVDTRNGGRVVIDLSDGSMVVVDPGSLLVLKDFRQAGSLRELFEILAGKVRVNIHHFGGRPNPYRMNSPTASIAVRGTEFSIQVEPDGGTQVIVYSGTVEVTNLSDPNQTILIEAGRGVLVQAGQDFHLIGAVGSSPLGRPAGDRHDLLALGGPPQPPVPAPTNDLGAGVPKPRIAPGAEPSTTAPRSPPSAYDNYLASLTDVDQMAFLFRFNAFPESHLDSLENPAYATQFTSAEARAFVLPTFGGGPNAESSLTTLAPAGIVPSNYSVSPQVSLFTPIGHSNFFVGGSVSGSRLSESAAATAPAVYATGGVISDFYSASLVAARKFGATSIGAEFEFLRGSGSYSSATTDLDPQPLLEQIFAASRISQSRWTAGISHDFGRAAKVGLFYRYGGIQAIDSDISHTVGNIPVGLNSAQSAGHSAEIGFRVRGLLKPRWFYGATGSWLQVSLADRLVEAGNRDSHERDRARRASAGLGLGYLPSRRLAFILDLAAGNAPVESSRFEDATGNLLQNAAASTRFVSAHFAVQADLSRRLFASASLLKLWRNRQLNVDLFPDQFGALSLVENSFFPYTTGAYQLASRFSDFGLGWKFSPHLFAEYLFTTSYGATACSHAVMLRYSFKLHNGE